jgi:hypothetical protein
MLHQKETTEYGQWLRAQSPTRRHERGSGKNALRREFSHNFEGRKEGAQPPMVAGGGHVQTEGVDDECQIVFIWTP